MRFNRLVYILENDGPKDMSRRSFLKTMGKTPAAAAVNPTGFLKAATGGTPAAPNLVGAAMNVLKMFKPLTFDYDNIADREINLTPTSYGDMSLGIGVLKNELMKLAFRNKSNTPNTDLIRTITNNTIESLDDAANDFAHIQSFLSDPMNDPSTDMGFTSKNIHTSAYDENIYGAQSAIQKALLLIQALNASNPNLQQFVKDNFNEDITSPEFKDKIVQDIKEYEENKNFRINRLHDENNDLRQAVEDKDEELAEFKTKEEQKQALKKKRKEGRKKQKQRQQKQQLKQSWKEKQVNYPRFDRAGGSEDEGYAKYFENYCRRHNLI